MTTKVLTTDDLRGVRLAWGITAARLAEEIGVSVYDWLKIETAKRTLVPGDARYVKEILRVAVPPRISPCDNELRAFLAEQEPQASPDATWLRAVRTERQWTQQALAAFLGVSQTYVSHVESGARVMPKRWRQALQATPRSRIRHAKARSTT